MLYTDTGIAANRVSVVDAGGLAQALSLGQPLWVPAGNHDLPANVTLSGVIDVACDHLAIVRLTGPCFINNGSGSLIWRGGAITGDGNDALVSLNSATELPALIDIQDATFRGVAEVNWSEWTVEPNGMIDELILKRNFLDMMGIGRGTYIQNGVRRATVEDYECRNFDRFGLMVAVHGNRPAQQQYVEWGKFKNIRLIDGVSGGNVTNSNCLYLAGRNYDVDGLTITGWRIKTDANGNKIWSADGDEKCYFKLENFSLRNFYFENDTPNLTIKGQSFDNSTGDGPVGGSGLVENGRIVGGNNGILDQCRGVVYRNIETIGLTGCAYINHQTSGPALIQGWRDHSRAEDGTSLTDNGKGVFTNRSDNGSLGVVTIMCSSVQDFFKPRATKASTGRIYDTAFGNNW